MYIRYENAKLEKDKLRQQSVDIWHWSDIDLVSIRAIMQLIVYEAAMILVLIYNHELLFWEQAFCEKLEIFDFSLL